MELHTDFNLKKIKGTNPHNEYFVITQTPAMTVGVRAFLQPSFGGELVLGMRVRALTNSPETAAEDTGLELIPKSDEHASQTFVIPLGNLFTLAAEAVIARIQENNLGQVMTDHIVGALKKTIGVTEPEFVVSEALQAVIDDVKMRADEDEVDFTVHAAEKLSKNDYDG